MTIERKEHPEGTPQGGAYTVTVYTDDNGVEVDKDRATRVIISEYDAGDKWLFETVGVL